MQYQNSQEIVEKVEVMGIGYDIIYMDKWDSFLSVFQYDNHIVGIENTKSIEGNNCCLRYLIRWAFRKICCFLKHFTFDLAFFYIIFQLRLNQHILENTTNIGYFKKLSNFDAIALKERFKK